jgi:FkbM family methyltransferase
MSVITRLIDHPALSTRVASSVSNIPWPNITFRPRTVRVAGVEILLIPHFNEFDLDCMFAKTLDYETTSFHWLESHAGEFDAVIEIGANVGVFTVFLDRVARREGSRLKHIYAFEPSPLAFERLRSNVSANECSNAAVFNVAVGERGGMLPFYEPEDHLTNGSFSREFAARFSQVIEERLVPVIAAEDLEELFRRHDRILLKIDVETYEPQLISALATILARYRPTIIVEVLTATASAIESAPWPPSYSRYLLDERLTEHPHFFADSEYRDWLLVPQQD